MVLASTSLHRLKIQVIRYLEKPQGNHRLAGSQAQRRRSTPCSGPARWAPCRRRAVRHISQAGSKHGRGQGDTTNRSRWPRRIVGGVNRDRGAHDASQYHAAAAAIVPSAKIDEPRYLTVYVRAATSGTCGARRWAFFPFDFPTVKYSTSSSDRKKLLDDLAQLNTKLY
jgi:hypothetical protein